MERMMSPADLSAEWRQTIMKKSGMRYQTELRDTSAIRADLDVAVRRWIQQDLGNDMLCAPPVALNGHRRSPLLDSATTRAIELVNSGSKAQLSNGSIGDIIVVVKAPHITTRRGLAAAVARMLAFGVDIRGIYEVEHTSLDIAAALYPAASRHFADLPSPSTALWAALLEVFDVPEFTSIFGEPFSSDLIVPARQVMTENGLDDEMLYSIWASGRAPLPCKDLMARFGGRATCRALVEAPDRPMLKRKLGHTWLHRSAARLSPVRSPEHTWFHCALPLGIQRVSSGLMAFALKHHLIYGGRPTVILNGHLLGLSNLFEPGSPVIEVGLPDGVSLAKFRKWVIGADAHPGRCQPGSVRRDAEDGTFLADSSASVDARANVLHCSDGLLAGLRERLALLGGPPTGTLVEGLRKRGVTPELLTSVVLPDPEVGPHGSRRRLTDITRGQDFADCIDGILEFAPISPRRTW